MPELHAWTSIIYFNAIKRKFDSYVPPIDRSGKIYLSLSQAKEECAEGEMTFCAEAKTPLMQEGI